jgi:hypothetical protein
MTNGNVRAWICWRLQSLPFHLLWILQRRYELWAETSLSVAALAISVPPLLAVLQINDLKSWIQADASYFLHPYEQLEHISGRLLMTVWLGAVGLYATRRLAANQLGPKLLERFNGKEMYASRRRAYRELFWWSAGDRAVLIQYEAELPYWGDLRMASPNEDHAVGISQVLGFAAELQHYARRGLVDRTTARALLRDRFSWFIFFFEELAEEIKLSHDRLERENLVDKRALYPFPFCYPPHTVRWLRIYLDLHAFTDDKVSRLQQGVPDQVAEYPQQTEFIQGLHKQTDIQEFQILLDSNYFQPGSIFARRNERAEKRQHKFPSDGRGGFVRLRVKREDWRHYLLLDVGIPRPTTFLRYVDYVSFDVGRYWYTRLTIQGAVPREGVPNPYATS